MTKPTYKSIDQAEQTALDKLAYQAHDMGELGKFIRVDYAENILIDYGKERDRIAYERGLEDSAPLETNQTDVKDCRIKRGARDYCDDEECECHKFTYEI